MQVWHFITVIYPNPVVDEVTVNLNKKDEGTIEIYNDNGQRIFKKNIKDLKNRLRFNYFNLFFLTLILV